MDLSSRFVTRLKTNETQNKNNMKKKVLTFVILCLIAITVFSQTLNKNTLCKKWYLHHYEHLWIDYEPEANEKNDFIQFNNDMTYVSVDIGQESSGKWSFNNKEKYILMYDTNDDYIKLLVKKLDSDAFVFEIEIKEMEGIEIHCSNTKKQ